MTPLAKLAGFAAVLALVFAGAAVAGGVADVDRSSERGDGGAGARRGARRRDAAPQPVRGLAVSDGRPHARARRARARRPGERFELAFRIAGTDGRTVRDFDVEHTKRMHVIVVRRDMTGFQHVHPTQRADGSWSVPVTLDDAGTYRVFADFSVDGTARTLATDLTVDGAVRRRAAARPGDRRRGRRPARAPRRGASTAGASLELALHRHARRRSP